ncbi:alpha-2-macroglobulin [Vibrio breoganii]
MKVNFKIFTQIMGLYFFLFFTSYSMAAQVTHVSEGKINNKTSIVVSLEGAVKRPLNLTVVKEETRLNSPWVLSADKTFQYLPIEQYGIGEYSVSLAGVQRGDLDKVEQISIYESSPSVRVLGQGPFINASGDRAIPIESVNANGALLSIYKVEDTPKLFTDYFYSKRLSSWSAQRLRKNFTHQTDLSFKLPPADANKSTVSNLTLPDDLANGWYIVAIKPTNSFDNPDIFHVLLSDIGVQAKVFDEQISLQAVDLKSNRPLSSAKVTVMSKEGVRSTVIMNNGFTQFDYKQRSSEDVIVVESNRSMAVLPMKEIPLDLSDFDVAGEHDKVLNAFVFSNRDLFKPAENVPVNIVVRQESGELSNTKSVFVEVVAPDGKVAISRTLNESLSGFFALDFDIPSSAKLGKWSLNVRSNRSSKDNLGSFNFNVSEFVPERMDLTVTLPKSIVAGKPIAGQAEGRYLFGQAADGNKLRISPTLRSIDHFTGKYQDYFVGKKHTISYRQSPDAVDMNLNAQGKGSFTLDSVSSSALDGPAMLTTNNQLFETGGATTTRVSKILISNGKSIVGVKPAAGQFAYFEDAKFSLMLLDDLGETALQGSVNIKVERNRGGYYWVYNQSSGWDLRRDDRWRIVESKSVNLNTSQNQLNIPVEWGQYRLVATAPSGQETVYRFYVGWRDGDDQIPVKPDQLSMKLDKESYLAGDYINLEIASPVSGLVSLELVGDKTYVNETVRIKGKGRARLKLPSALERHDLYIIATLVNAEQSYVRRSLAVAPVKLYREHRKLTVDIEAPSKLEPFTTQNIKVKVAGKRDLDEAYVVLSVADKGIINMSRYQVPSIFNWFYGQKRLGADLIDLYSRQFESRPSSFIRHRYGGDEDANGNKPIDDLVESKTFNTVLAPVKVNSKGEANIALDVPDYNGEVQVVATVFDGNKFGQKVEDVAVSAPIVAELSVPRFFATDNQSQVMVEASNQTDETQTIELALTASNGVTLKGSSSKTVQLAPQQKAHFPVAVSVGSVVAMSDLTLSVKSDAYSVERNWRVPVRSPSPYVTKKSTRTLVPGDFINVTQAQWNGVLPMDQGMSSISFSRVPEIEPTAFVQGLFRYPYGCVEQTTSTAYPWLLNDASLAPIKEKALGERTDKDMLQRAVLRLADYQGTNGGFGLWGRSSREEAWLTSYVASFLFEVNEAHPNLVNKSLMDKTFKRLREYIYADSSVDDKAYAGYVLSRAGLLSYSDAKSYLSKLNSNNRLTNAYLGAVFYSLGDMRSSRKYFNAVDLSREVYSRNYYYDSHLSSHAKIVSIVSALEANGPINDQLAELRIESAKAIFGDLNARRYFSTQEKYALAKAGFELQALNEQEILVSYNGQQVSVSEPLNMEVGDKFNNTSDDVMYVTESIEGYADPSALKSSVPFENVTRVYFDTSGKELRKSSIKVGDTVIAKVTVRLAEKINRAMLIDYLPAGMVLENPNFTASKELLESLGFESSSTEMEEFRNDRYVTALNLRERRTYQFYYVMRAETPGISDVPNVFIEDMYAPERYIYQPGFVRSLSIK